MDRPFLKCRTKPRFPKGETHFRGDPFRRLFLAWPYTYIPLLAIEALSVDVEVIPWEWVCAYSPRVLMQRVRY